MILKKTYLLLIILFITTAVLATHNVKAHSPSNMDLEYNKDEEELSVEITHSVSNTNDHFIEKVAISVEGKEVESKNYASQPDPEKFTYKYNISANDGDEIKVTADCSQTGSITETLIVGPENGEWIISGYLGFFGITFFSLISTVWIYKRKQAKP